MIAEPAIVVAIPPAITTDKSKAIVETKSIRIGITIAVVRVVISLHRRCIVVVVHRGPVVCRPDLLQGNPCVMTGCGCGCSNAWEISAGDIGRGNRARNCSPNASSILKRSC